MCPFTVLCALSSQSACRAQAVVCKGTTTGWLPLSASVIDKPHTVVLWQDNCTDHPECAAESCQNSKAKPPSIKSRYLHMTSWKDNLVPQTSVCLCSRTELSNTGWKTAMTALALGRVITTATVTGKRTKVCLPLTCNPGTCPWLQMERVALRYAGGSSNPWATPAGATVAAL